MREEFYFYSQIGCRGGQRVRKLIAEGLAPKCAFCGEVTKLDEDLNGEPTYTCVNKKCECTIHCTKAYIEAMPQEFLSNVDESKKENL